MKNKKSLSGKFSGKDQPAAEEKTPKRKDGSVLVQRAVIFAAAILLVFVIVFSPVYHLVDRHCAVQNAKNVLEKLFFEMEILLEDYEAGQVSQLRENGFGAGLDFTVGSFIGYESAEDIVPDDAWVNEEWAALLKAGWDGETSFRMVNYDGSEWLRGAKGMDIPNEESARTIFTIDLSMESFGGSKYASLIGLIAGFIAACIMHIPLKKWILTRSVCEISGLRDTAVKIAEGEFDAHADENIPGEMGELGAALNNLSYQLSRNMYMLIVERNRLKHMLNGLSEGIIAIDAGGQITHINPAIAQMFEQKRISVGLPDPRMKHVPDESVWKDFDAVIKSGEASTRNITIRDMIIRIVITPIVDEIGTIAGAVGLFSDITQSERLERTRREYVSNVSHELRTPLTAVRALIEPL